MGRCTLIAAGDMKDKTDSDNKSLKAMHVSMNIQNVISTFGPVIGRSFKELHELFLV